LNNFRYFLFEAGPQWLGLIPIIGNVAAAGITTMQAYSKNYGELSNEQQAQSETEIHLSFDTALRNLAKKKTVVLILDDLQWADSSSLNLLFTLVRQIRQSPYKILLIGAFRPTDIQMGRNRITSDGRNENMAHPLIDKLNEFRNYTKQEGHIQRTDEWYHELELHSFTTEDVNAFLNFRFPKNHFPTDLATQLKKITGGHVLFVVEIVNSLVQKGTIYNDSQGFALIKVWELTEMPTSVNGIIAERIRHLTEDLKKVLDYASVAGESFSVQVLEQVLKMDELDLLDYIEALSKKYSLLSSGGTEQIKGLLLDLYHFTNGLLHHYIYENMEASRRRALHRRIASITQELYGDSIKSMPDVKAELMRHTQIGQGLIDGLTMQLTLSQIEGEESNSVEKIKMAKAELEIARENFKQHAISECLMHLDKALAFISEENKLNSTGLFQIQFEAYELYAEAYSWSGFYQNAYDASLQMLNATQQNEQWKIAAFNRLGYELSKLGRYDESSKYHNMALELLTKYVDEPTEAITLGYLAKVQFEKGFYDEALSQFLGVLNKYEKLAMPLQLGETLNNTGNCHRYMGDYATAITWYEKALELFRKNDFQQWMATSISNIGLCYNGVGDFDVAIDYFNKALAIDNKINDRVGRANHTNNIGFALELKGLYDQALEFYLKTLEIDESMNNYTPMAKTLNNIANIFRLKADFDTSQKYLERALIYNQEVNDLVGLSTTYTNMGNNFYTRGNLEQAYEYYSKALDIDIALNDQMALATSYTNMGNVAYSNAQMDEAYSYYLKCLEIVQRVNDTLSEAVAFTNIGNIFLAKDNHDEALSYMKKAMNIYEKASEKPSLALVCQNIAALYSDLVNYDLSIEYFQKAVAIDEEISDWVQLAVHTTKLANECYNAERTDLALVYYKKLLELDKKQIPVDDISYLYSKVGRIYSDKEEYNEAIHYYLTAIDLTKKENNNANYAIYNYNVGNAYRRLEKYEKALEYYFEAVKAFEKEDDSKLDLADCYNLIGFSYYMMEISVLARRYLEMGREIFIEYEVDTTDIDAILNELPKSGHAPKD
jgi:tetratricopeptide (TPR) repeat protein